MDNSLGMAEYDVHMSGTYASNSLEKYTHSNLPARFDHLQNDEK
jgi:hypothetical protein